MKSCTASSACLGTIPVHVPSLHSPLWRLKAEDPVKVERMLVKLEKLHSTQLDILEAMIACLLPLFVLPARASDQLYTQLGMTAVLFGVLTTALFRAKVRGL